MTGNMVKEFNFATVGKVSASGRMVLRMSLNDNPSHRRTNDCGFRCTDCYTIISRSGFKCYCVQKRHKTLSISIL